MAESEDGNIYWHSPDPRAIFPFEAMRMPRSLRQSIRKYAFEFKIDTAFELVIRSCAAREETWISEEIIDLYSELHYLGYAHSVETWQNGNLVGGLYGVAINAAFFGESMFNFLPDASKASFFYLVELLKKQGFLLLDSQYINDYTRSLGAIEIPKKIYMDKLRTALKVRRLFEINARKS